MQFRPARLKLAGFAYGGASVSPNIFALWPDSVGANRDEVALPKAGENFGYTGSRS